MNEEEHIELFFENLSCYFTNENSLSDVVVAAMEASEGVKNSVLEALGLPIADYYILREWNTEHGRPDIKLVDRDDVVTLIEVKKYDTNYHDKYFKIDAVNKFILLTAHKPTQDVKWEVRYWKDVIDKLEESNSPMARGLSRYIKNVLGVKAMKAVDFKRDGIKAMMYLDRLIKSVLSETSLDDMTIIIDNRSVGHAGESSGYYFSVNRDGIRSKQWFYLAVVFDDKEDGLIVTVSKTIGEKGIEAMNQKFPEKIRRNDYGHYYVLWEWSDFEAITGKEDDDSRLEKQKNYLTDMLRDVIACVSDQITYHNMQSS